MESYQGLHSHGGCQIEGCIPVVLTLKPMNPEEVNQQWSSRSHRGGDQLERWRIKNAFVITEKLKECPFMAVPDPSGGVIKITLTPSKVSNERFHLLSSPPPPPPGITPGGA
jgi:hypothetical protein